MLPTIIGWVFNIVGYSLFLYGMWLLVGEYLYKTYVQTSVMLWMDQKKTRRFRELNQENQEKKRAEPLIIEHLNLMINSVKKRGSNKNASSFIFLTCTIFGVTTITITVSVNDILLGLVFGMIVSCFPYLYYWFRLTKKRLETSLTFMNEFHIVVQNYETSNKDVYYMLKAVIDELKDKTLKSRYQQLLFSMQTERSNTEFKNAVRLFTFGINSTFAKRFGSLIERAHLNNADISDALRDLNADITRRKQDMAEEKTLIMEPVILGYLPIFIIPLLVFMAWRLAGARDFYRLFTSETPLTFFILIVILSILGVFMSVLLSKPKADM